MNLQFIQKLFVVFILIFILPLYTKADLGWTLQTSGTNQNLYSVCFININTGFIVGSNGILIKTINAGNNWITQQIGTNNYFYCIRFPSSNIGYIASANGIIIKTTNSGLNWNFYSTGVTGPPYSMSFLDETIGYLITYMNYFIKTTNGGLNWSSLPSGIADINSVFFVNPNYGFVAGSTNLTGKIEKTTNGGISSFSLNVPYTFSYNGLFFINSNIGYSAGNSGLIIKTTDGGSNWFSQTLTNNTLLSVFFPSIDTGFICGYFGTILKTTNGGLNWFIQQNYATSNNLHEIYFINNLTGYAVGDNGTIIKTSNGGEPIGIKPISNNVPEKFELFQNYPNPFNPSTKIKFDLSSTPLLSKEGTGVVLKIYDLLGSEVSTLLNEKLQPGTYEVNWDAYNFSSGIYFYKLTVGNFTETKRMVLLK